MLKFCSLHEISDGVVYKAPNSIVRNNLFIEAVQTLINSRQ